MEKRKQSEIGNTPQSKLLALSKQAHSSQDCTMKLEKFNLMKNGIKSSAVSDESETEETQEIILDHETRETENLSYAEYESHYDEIWAKMFHNHRGVFYNLDETPTVNDKYYKDPN